MEYIMEDRVLNLEKAFIKLELTMSVFTEKMSDIAQSINTMSNAISKLALVDMRLTRVEQDITNVSINNRDLRTMLNGMDTTHTQACNTNLEIADKKGVGRLILGVTTMTTLIGVAFGYLYLDIKLVSKQEDMHQERVAQTEKDVAVILTKLGHIEDSLEKATGHRFYTVEESDYAQ